MRVLVTGGRNGYLGRRVVSAVAAAGHDPVAVGSVDGDVRDIDAVRRMLAAARPDAVVHTAYVQSDWDVTATGAAHVAVAAREIGARLVLVSSDVVFGGRPEPYTEEDRPDPVSAYGAAKAAAETCALAGGGDAVVARTSLICGDGHSAHEALIRELVDDRERGLFEDEVRCPVHVDDLATALVELAVGTCAGVLHLGGAEAMTRLELGRLVAAREGLDPSRLRATSRMALGVPGPVEVRLDSTRASSLLTTPLRGAREFLA